jgi:uncharacterized protein YndB with AHSA1/START domain
MTETLPPICEEIEIIAGRDHVWRVMTGEESVPTWLGCLGYKRALGHVFYMQQDETRAAAGDISGATHCEILAIEEPHHFRFSWFLPGFPPTFVSFRLQERGSDRTLVLFEHEGWEQFPRDHIKPIRDALSSGWKSFVLPGLKRASET